MSTPCAPAIGITGGIACGKSEVGRVLEAHGVAVLDTDRLAHELMSPGEATFDAVVAAFGNGILAADGTIDRKRLGERVFADPEQLAQLNQLVHPAVGRAWRAWLKAQVAAGKPAAVLIPLLFEVGATRDWDAIVTVAAQPETVRERLKERGLDRAAAEARIASQWPLEKKIAAADYVLQNDGSLEDLRAETLKILTDILLLKENEKENDRRTET